MAWRGGGATRSFIDKKKSDRTDGLEAVPGG